MDNYNYILIPFSFMAAATLQKWCQVWGAALQPAARCQPFFRTLLGFHIFSISFLFFFNIYF